MIRRKDLYTALADSAFRFPDKIALLTASITDKLILPYNTDGKAK